MFVKICGLQDVESARVAVESGADALGFILAPSRRQVTPETVATIRGELSRDRGQVPPIVGVAVNASAESIAHDRQTAGLDMIQLSGDEEPAILSDVDIPVIKALRFGAGASLDDALRQVDAWLSGPTPALRVIVEGHAEGTYGGTGTRADWDFVVRIAERYPIVLAGGLTPNNVAEAIGAVRPAGVDVSSGVETDGMKDADKIRDFVSRFRSGAV